MADDIFDKLRPRELPTAPEDTAVATQDDPWAGLRPQMEATPQPVSPDRSIVADLARAPYAFARNAITALPGAPGDIGSLVDLGLDKWLRMGAGAGSPQRPGTGPRPGGFGILPTQESLNKRIDTVTGITGEPSPGWAGAPERVAGFIGSSYGPGKFTREMEGALKLTNVTGGVWGAIKNSLTAGSKGDVAIGAMSGLSQEAVRQFFTDNPWMLGAAATLGGIAPALAHWSYGALARPFQKEQTARQLETITRQTEREGQQTLQSAATDVQTARDLGKADATAAQQANRAAVTPLVGAAEAKRGLMTTAAEDLAMAEEVAKARLGTVQAQGEQWKQAATLADERAAATRAAAGTPPGAYDQLGQTLDLTSPPQGTLATGQAIKEQVAETGAAQTQAAAQARMPAYQAATTGMGTPDVTPQGVIDITKGDFAPQFQKQKQLVGDNLDRIEKDIAAAASPVGGVSTDNIRSEVGRLVKEAVETPGASVSPEVLAYAEMGLSEAQKKVLKGTGLQRAQQALAMTPEVEVPFSALRKIDRDLGAEGRGNIVGTMPQGEARALKSALNKDFDEFFNSDAGTQLSPEFQQYKKDWRDFRTNFDKSILGHLLDERAGYQQQNFISFLHGGNAKTNPQLSFIMEHASDETKQAIKGHMLGYMAKTDAAGNLDPAALGRNIRKLRENGTMDLYFDPGEQRTLVETWQTLSAADTSVEPQFRKLVAKTLPEQLPARVFAPGNISFTEKFQKISTPQQYQEAVSGWAASVKARLPDMTPDQIHKEFAPMVVKHDGVSQLDVMFAHIPGAADKITDMVTAHRVPTPTTGGAPQGPSRTMQQAESAAAANLQYVQAENAKQLALVKDLYTQAQQEYKDALKLAKETRAAGSQVTRETRERAQQAVDVLERKQRQTKQDVDTETQVAKDRLREAREEAKMSPTGESSRRSGLTAFSGIGLMGLLSNIQSHNPWVAGGSALLIAGDVGRTAKNAFFQSQMGQKLIHNYVPQVYGPKAGAFTAQVLGQQASRIQQEEAMLEANRAAEPAKE